MPSEAEKTDKMIFEKFVLFKEEKLTGFGCLV